MNAALAKLASGDRAGALAELVAVWPTTPYPRLGDAIDRLDATLPRKPNAWRKPKGAALRDLLAALTEGTLAEIGERLAVLAKRRRDPRTAHVLLELVRTAPWTSDSSRFTWNPLFELLARLGDPRVRVHAEAILAGWAMRRPHRVWLASKLDAVVLQTCAIPKETAADRALLDQLEAALVGALPRSGRHDTAAMLASIYANPFDDALRSVYADALLERGDPRGELIQLQLLPSPSPAVAKRIAVLLRKHARAWLGGIEPVINKEGVVFERGFVTACKVRFRHEGDVRAYGSHPAWATVERLEHSFPYWGAGAQYRFYGWIDPAMKSLTSVRVTDDTLDDLLAAPRPWRIQRLTFGTDKPADFGKLGRTAKLPALTALACDEPPPGWLAKARFGAQLRELSLEISVEVSAPWIQEAAALPKLEVLEFDNLVLRRDAKRRFSVGSVAVSWRQDNQLSELNGLPNGVLTELTLTPGPRLAPEQIDAAFRRELTRVARTQSKLEVLDLTALGGKRDIY